MNVVVDAALGNKPWLESREDIISRAQAAGMDYSEEEITHMRLLGPRRWELNGGVANTQQVIKAYHKDPENFVKILEEFGMGLSQSTWKWDSYKSYGYLIHGSGETPIIAVMRCFVRLRLGSVVEIPDELGEL